MLARTCALALLLLILACGTSFADETSDAELLRSAKVTNLSPEKDALVVCMDAEPEGVLDQEA